MISFQHRSYKKELLDRDDIPFEDIKRNMQELDIINKRLGGHSMTLDGIKTLLRGVPPISEPLRIVEIGCGGGDNLRAINEWANRSRLPVSLTGVDINEECIAYAAGQQRNASINFIHSDYQLLRLETVPHIVFSSLFCHHFTDVELADQLRWMKTHSSIGFFINDLHRHPLAYYSIKLLTQLFSRSYLVKNDAPLSVQRGFTRADWQQLLELAGIENYSCTWKWAFRWLVTCSNNAA